MPESPTPMPPILERIYAAIQELQMAIAELQPLVQQTGTHAGGEEYLPIKELVRRIPYGEQTIRNLVAQGELREGQHYLQRVKHGRVVFVWSRMQEWMRTRQSTSPRQKPIESVEPFYRVRHAHTHKER